jgi:hypothetical protein
MGCPALGVGVAFLKQAAPDEEPQTKNKKFKYKIYNTKSQMNQKYFLKKKYFFWGRSARQCIRLF